MGLRSSLILCAGGFLSNLVLVPLIWMIGRHLPEGASVYPSSLPIATMSAEQIFRGYVRFVGVGAIATAGHLRRPEVAAHHRGLVRDRGPHLPCRRGARRRAHRPRSAGRQAARRRSGLDARRGRLLSTLGQRFGVVLVGLLLTLVFSFFFTSVAANAIAITARNPISGMTMLTVIVSSVVLLRFGVSGPSGMFFVMAIAGVVATALAVSGQFVTDLKTGYWLGSTPATLQKTKFLGLAPGRTRRRAHDRDAGTRVPVRRGGARRPARGAAGAAGLDHEVARRGLPEPAAGGLHPVRRRRGARPDHGDARRAGADLRARHVPAARAQHAGPRRRLPGALPRRARPRRAARTFANAAS